VLDNQAARAPAAARPAAASSSWSASAPPQPAVSCGFLLQRTRAGPRRRLSARSRLSAQAAQAANIFTRLGRPVPFRQRRRGSRTAPRASYSAGHRAAPRGPGTRAASSAVSALGSEHPPSAALSARAACCPLAVVLLTYLRPRAASSSPAPARSGAGLVRPRAALHVFYAAARGRLCGCRV